MTLYNAAEEPDINWQRKAEQLDTVCRHLRRVAKGDLAQNDGVNHKSLAYEVVESINDILLPDTDEEETDTSVVSSTDEIQKWHAFVDEHHAIGEGADE